MFNETVKEFFWSIKLQGLSVYKDTRFLFSFDSYILGFQDTGNQWPSCTFRRTEKQYVLWCSLWSWNKLWYNVLCDQFRTAVLYQQQESAWHLGGAQGTKKISVTILLKYSIHSLCASCFIWKYLCWINRYQLQNRIKHCVHQY